MNNKLQQFIAPGRKLFLVLMCLFAAAAFFFNQSLGLIESAIVLLLIVYSLLDARKRRKELVEYIESVTYDAESAKNNTLLHFPLPIVVFKLSDYQIVWGNQIFFDLFGSSRPRFDALLNDMVPGFSSRWLMEGKNQYPGLVQIGERKYQIHGNIVSRREGAETGKESDFMGITYWVDMTDYDRIRTEYNDSRPVTMLLVVDNYDELTKNLTDRAKNGLRASIDDVISAWSAARNGFARSLDRDRYLVLLESRHLKQITDEKFSVLEEIHKVVNSTGIHATLSIGVGRDGSGFEENYSFASLAVEMALSRGGDQAVIKNKFNFEFFGGRGTEVETRSKVRSRVTAGALASLIRASSQVFIMGHKMADMDALAGAVGMACICRKLAVPFYIVVDPVANASHKVIERMKAEPEYRDAFLTPQEAILRADSRTLLIVVDTNRPEQVESLSLLESCTRVAVIDHHRRAASYIQNAALTFHEPYASSVGELVTELVQELTEPQDVTRAEAEAILAGIVLDTKNFSLRTGERTFDAAAFLRRMGAETSEVKKLFQSDMEHTVEKYSILQRARVYRDGIAVAISEGEQDRVVAAQAADELLNVSGIQASFVLYATKQGGVVISGRSIGELNVQLILEKLGGGGNKSAAGVQIQQMSLTDAVKQLKAAIDDYFENK
ncbi:MAG: DHH family phosphoesterase [Oscillospiraceae bacterium]|nr:DHH family phosphoesterase [Oscillospiraceae bacterium]